MTNPDLTLIAVVLDRSGSMETIRTDTEGGFSAFIDQQRGEPGTALVTLAQFDNTYERVYSNKPIADVPRLQLIPRGATALYDAVGRLTSEIGEELAKIAEAERPGKVIVVVLTDGHENSSREWTHDSLRKVITRQEQEYSWEYVFLGANMDAVATARNIGIQADRAITYATSKAGVEAVFGSAAGYVSRSRAARPGAAPAGFSAQDRAAAAEE